MNLRNFLGLAVGLAIAGLAGVAAAQQASTWDQIQATKTLRVGCAASEPWCFKDLSDSVAPGGVKSNNITWRGVSVALGKSIADAMGVKLEIVETSWGNAVAGLQANQFDVMFILDATPERKEAIDFVGPVLWYPVALLANNDFAPKTWDEMNDPKYSFGAPNGTNFADILRERVPKAQSMLFQQSSEVVAAFQAGRIIGYLTTAPNADVARSKLGRGMTLVPTPRIGLSTDGGIRKESDQRWHTYLQEQVTKFYNDGVTQKAYEQFLAFRGLDPTTATSIRKEDWK